LVLSSTGATEGLSALSPDGRYLAFMGYDADPLTANLSTSGAASVYG